MERRIAGIQGITGWDLSALPPGVLPIYDASIARHRVRQLYVRLVAERQRTKGLRGHAAYDELADGFQHALAIAGLRRVGLTFRVPCEQCHRLVATVCLHHGRWCCYTCLPRSRLATEVGRYVFAVRIGLHGALLKKRRSFVAKALAYCSEHSRNPAWGSLRDVGTAQAVLEKPMPPRVLSTTFCGGAFRAFCPWPRLSWTSGPWRKHMGIRVFVAMCEIGVHPQAVKAGLLDVVRRRYLTPPPSSR